ncbi:hypothetical protein [Polluticoccus soli]|uniref:hypothetical protein n=1 Tax=Polluticoccus soli TaxID=3034150 RepID=UPI0023E230D3|nr:hypothetical protein [Flavipsychrobacter sp. JY13-12]
MDLRAEILKEHSRVQSEKIAKWIGNNPDRFKEFMHLFLNDEYRVVQRAAWVLSVVAEKHHELALPYLPAMVKKMSEPGVHVAVKRNVVRILQFIEIPEELHGDIMNACFDLLGDLKETIAVRVFAMTVLANLAKTYPDIKQELRTIIEDELSHEPSKAFIARSKQLLKNL